MAGKSCDALQFRKTRWNRRETYTYEFADGQKVTVAPGEAGCTQIDIRRLHSMDEQDEKVHNLLAMARTLEGMPRHASTHAAGVLITAKPVSDFVPLQTNADVITTQYPMGTLESLGLLKMDFLGLRTLNVIGDSLRCTR